MGPEVSAVGIVVLFTRFIKACSQAITWSEDSVVLRELLFYPRPLFAWLTVGQRGCKREHHQPEVDTTILLSRDMNEATCFLVDMLI